MNAAANNARLRAAQAEREKRVCTRTRPSYTQPSRSELAAPHEQRETVQTFRGLRKKQT